MRRAGLELTGHVEGSDIIEMDVVMECDDDHELGNRSDEPICDGWRAEIWGECIFDGQQDTYHARLQAPAW